MMGVIKWAVIIFASVAGIVSCANSEWYVEYSNERYAREVERNKPQVILKSDDGCSVYAFKAGGDWRYFTRCGADRVETKSDYTVPCGKARCGRTESIQTLPQQ